MEPVNKASAQTAAIKKSLDVGSGVDIDALARSLASAEGAARIDTTNKRLASVESRISGYSVVSTFMSGFRQKFLDLQDVSKLSSKSVITSDSSRMPATVNSSAQPGRHSVQVQQLAAATTRASASFAASTSSLNNGTAFNIEIQVGSKPLSVINVPKDTPAGLVEAINAANIGVRATLINKNASANDWQIVLQGQSGASADFTVASSTAAVNLGLIGAGNRLTTAQDALITVNGVANIARSSNQIADVIPGVQFDIRSDPGQSVSIVVEQSNQLVKEKVNGLVNSYNEFMVVLKQLSLEVAVADDKYSGTLSRDKDFVNTLRSELRSLMTQNSSTPESGIVSLRDLGLTFAVDGTASINQKNLDLAVSTKPDAVAKMLSAGTDNTSDLASEPKGFAQDISIRLNAMLSPQGIISQRKLSGNTQIAVYKRDLQKLELRLETAYKRYISQFSSMESLVQRMDGVGKYLKGQFTAMENMYKN